MAILTTGNSVGLTAQEHRNQTAALLPPFKTALGVRGGVHSGLGIKKTSGMQFSIDPGRAVVEPSSPSSGPYVVTIDAQERLSFEPGDDTKSRIDLVCVKVDETAGIDQPGSLVIVKGAYPSSGDPVRPSIPKAHEALYAVPISAGMSAGSGGWTASTAVDLRRNLVSNGAAIPVNSKSERDALAPFEGMQVMRLDLQGSVDRYVKGRWIGNTDWILCTYSAGWRGVSGGTPLRVRLTADGRLGMLGGEVIYTTPNRTPTEGDIIGHIPPSAMAAGLMPENNSWVIGTDDSYSGLNIFMVRADGTIRLGPRPNGKIFMFQGTFPIEMQ